VLGSSSLEMDPFLKKKWERVFYTFFDVNRNKVIDWNDFEILFEKIKELRGEDSNEYRIVHEAMRMVWQGLVSAVKGLDMYSMSGGDLEQEISLTEWDALWQKYDPKHMHIWQWEYLKYMFLLIDTSGDKLIDKDEYHTVMNLYGVSKSDADKSFEKFAVDEKGKKVEKINYGQFVKLWNEFFTSKDKNAPGNHLFGPV